MCRILGHIGEDFNKNNFDTALRYLKPGGPDGQGQYFNQKNKVYLGHTRLAILDLTKKGKQPMRSWKNNCIVVYNGEIYNFQELKKQLINSGYKFKSQTDTEVILNGYLKWGVKIFEKLEGMFAVAIYDVNKKKIILARDYFGIKPLYYYKYKNCLSFASEVKALKLLIPNLKENPDWKINFLAFGFIPEPKTIYKNVYNLKSGHYLEHDIKKNRSSLVSFTKKTKINNNISNKIFLSKIYNKLDKSIKSCLISDTNLAVSLSGGYDSGYIAKVASQNHIIDSYSLNFKEKNLSEKTIIDFVVKNLKINNQQKILSKKDFNQNLNKIIKSYDQPTIDGVNLYFIAKFAKENKVKVLLSGLGSDEILLGYGNEKYYFIAKMLYKYKLIFKILIQLYPFNNAKFINKLKYIILNKELFYYLFIRGIYNPYEISQILNLPVNKVINVLNKNRLIINTKNEYTIFTSIQNHFYLKSQLLNDADKMSMKFGVEIRVPYLNYHLYQLLIIFFDYKNIKRYKHKKILKDRFKLLNKIILEKRGFSLPMDKWIKNLKVKNKIILNNKSHWSKKWALYLLDNYKI